MSDVLDWCIHSNSIDHEVPGVDTYDVKKLALETFSTNELERVVKLGTVCPEMLDFAEANMFRVMEGTPELWSAGSKRGNREANDFEWDKVEERLAELEELIVYKSEQYPVTGLTSKQVQLLGWDLSPLRK